MSYLAFQSLLKIGQNASKLVQMKTQLKPSQNITALFDDPFAKFDMLLEPLVQMPEQSSRQPEPNNHQPNQQPTPLPHPDTPNIQSTAIHSSTSDAVSSNTPLNSNMQSADNALQNLAHQLNHVSGKALPVIPSTNQQIPALPTLPDTQFVLPTTLRQSAETRSDVPRRRAHSIMDDPMQLMRMRSNLLHDNITERTTSIIDEDPLIKSQTTISSGDDIVQTQDAAPLNPTQLDDLRQPTFAHEPLQPNIYDTPQTTELQPGQRVQFANGGNRLLSILQTKLQHQDAPQGINAPITQQEISRDMDQPDSPQLVPIRPQATPMDRQHPGGLPAPQMNLAVLLEEIADQLEFDILRTYGTSGTTGE